RLPARLRRVCAALLLTTAAASAAELEVRVAEPFIELHTGPAAGYPVLQVVDRGEPLTLLRRRADWFQVRAEDGRVGWVPAEALARTLGREGEAVAVGEAGEADYRA